MMNDIRLYEPLWDAWYIDSLLGQGSFGTVYKVCREDFGKIYYAAVKIISVPHNEAEILHLRSEGMDDEAIRDYGKALVSNILREIEVMGKFRGNSNIVSFEDHQVTEKKDRIGWDILIRMELLMSLPEYAGKNFLPAAEVVKMGIHLCRALELCAVHNIIHRDIKPDNVFISRHGDYKLGDFGIARQIDQSTSGLSSKGEFSSRAPEISRGEEYGPSVDIYALGIVLYHYLNQNRPPFLPDYPQPIMPGDIEEAMRKRMSGEPLPVLTDITPALNDILQKACAYNSSDRFADPKEMREALEAAARDLKKESLGLTAKLSRLGPEMSNRGIPRTLGLAHRSGHRSAVPIQAAPVAKPVLDEFSFGNTPILEENMSIQAKSFSNEGVLQQDSQSQPQGGFDTGFLSGTVVLSESSAPQPDEVPVQMPLVEAAVPAEEQALPAPQKKPKQRTPRKQLTLLKQSQSLGQPKPPSELADPLKAPDPLKSSGPIKPSAALKKEGLPTQGRKLKKPFLVAGISAVVVLGLLAVAFFIFKPDGYGVSVNGQTDIVLAKKKEARAVLDELTAHYTQIASSTSNTVSSITFEEEVVIVGTKHPAEIKSKEDALQALINGRVQTIDYAVTQGETIKDIAQRHNVTPEAIMAVNEGLNQAGWTEESQLAGGTQIKVVAAQPYLHVIIEGVCDITEEIAYETEMKKDENVVKYTTEVEQAGEKGAKSVTCTYISRNGIFVQKTVLEERVIKEPVKEIVLEGTKALRITRRGEGITNEKLTALIESGEIPAYVTELDLSNNAISDLTLLESLTGLEVLNLNNNSVKSLKGLEPLSKLMTLSISDNSVSDLKPLEQLPQLAVIDFSSNLIGSLSSLKTLTALVTVDLSDNSVTDLAPLASLKNVKTLNLNQNEISSLSSVSSLKGLTDLSLADNAITDITPLKSLTGLKELELQENPGLASEKVEELKQVLTKCNIVYFPPE